MGSLIPITDFFQRRNLAIFLGTLLLPGIASAREIIVAPSGGEFATVAAGVSAALASDIVTVRAGIYNESVSFGRSGSAVAGYITLQGEPGAVLDGTGKSGQGIIINSKNYIRVIGMTVRKFLSGNTPMGISVEGSSSFIELRNNLIHNIESPNGNAHGIAFYGSAATPMTNIVVEGNEIRNCRLGQSEALVLNGNIDGFIVARNTVHDNDNIGIDFIGFEGTGPAALDQARNGICVDNVIYNNSSATNPTYGGERSAGGIYVDGGRDIVIERNKIDNCDIGIEVASEHLGKATSNITVRNNFISRGYLGNILMGGYAANRGDAYNVVVVNNTSYQGVNGEIELQHNCDRITVKNNILYARAGQSYISASGGNNTNVMVENNVYFGASLTSPGPFPDARARFVNPLLVSPHADLRLQAGSPAIDAGINLGLDALGQLLSGALDIDGRPRTQGSAIDIGAHEAASGGSDTVPPTPMADLRGR
jgi:parallel beta helix pectate lyase-like protein